MGDGKAGRHALSHGVEDRKAELGVDVPLQRRRVIPVGRLGEIRRQAQPVEIDGTEIGLGHRIAGLGGILELHEGAEIGAALHIGEAGRRIGKRRPSAEYQQEKDGEG